MFDRAQDALQTMPVPALNTAPGRLKLFVAAFDGTGNDAIGDPLHATNIGKLVPQARHLRQSGRRDVQIEYMAGIGTQSSPLARTLDGALGYTYLDKQEEMYKKFVVQAKVWLRENPAAQISIASIGFSRGAEQAASFTRMVHERGVQDPDGARKVRYPDGRIGIEYAGPPLVPPGLTAQAVGLLDPVGTGEPRRHDRRLPASVISGLQLTAEDERRGLFRSTSIIDTGSTADGRFLGVRVPGAHSNVGGGYHRDGLSARSGNLLVDYLNGLSDTPFLKREPVADDPRQDVVHRSHESILLYRLWNKVDRGGPDGVVYELAPASVCRIVPDCRNADPVDAGLVARFDFRQGIGIAAGRPIAVDGDVPGLGPIDPAHPDHALYFQSRAAVFALDDRLGRSHDLSSERLAAALTPQARRASMQRIDQVMLGQPGGDQASGASAFALQGDPGSPSTRWASVATHLADSTPLDQSFAQLERLQRAPAVESVVPARHLPEPLVQPLAQPPAP